jgi:hypothetical protein
MCILTTVIYLYGRKSIEGRMFHFRENVSKLYPVHICSVADPGCLSRIQIFSISDPDPHQRIFSALGNMFRDVHPDPDLDFCNHPGSRIQGSTRHRIPDPGPQHCIYRMYLYVGVPCLQKMVKRPRLLYLLVKCKFFQDESAKILEEKARESGVKVVYQTSDFPTGALCFLFFLITTIISVFTTSNFLNHTETKYIH